MRGARFAASIALLGSALLAACAAGAPGQMSATDPAIGLRDDSFRPYREYTAGRRSFRRYPNTVVAELIARVDRKTGTTTTFLSTDYRYWGRPMRTYESARNARSEALPFHKISRHRSCEKGDCIYDEQFEIEIPQEELRRAPSNGYQLKVFARTGDGTTITVAKTDIKRLLGALEKRAAQAATPTN